MNKKEKYSIAILLIILIITTPIAFAVEIQTPEEPIKVDIQEDFLKEQQEEELEDEGIAYGEYGEEIVVNVVDYRPKIVTANLLEENRLPVIAKLKGILATPFLKTEDVIINDVQIIRKGPSKFVSSVNSRVASPPGGYTLDDLGTATIWLRKIKKEEQVPEKIEVNATVVVRYERRGADIGAEHLTGLVEQKEEGWSWENPFFDQYYLRVASITANGVLLYIYRQGTDRPIYSLTLRRGEYRVIRLPGVSRLFEDFATITVDNIYGGGLTAELFVNNEVCVAGKNDFCIPDLKVISIDEDDKVVKLRSARDSLVLREGEEGEMTIGNLPKRVKFSKLNPAGEIKTLLDVNGYESQFDVGDSVGDRVNCIKEGKTFSGGAQCKIKEIQSNRVILTVPVRQGDNYLCEKSREIAIRSEEIASTPCGEIKLVSSEAQKRVDVTIAPGGGSGVSESDITFHIGVEKRLIKLTPEEIDEQINKTKEQIKKLDDIINDLEKVVKTWMTACFITFTVLTIKNFFTGLSGGAFARRLASAEIKNDYETYRSKETNPLPFDMWYSREEYSAGEYAEKTPKQKQVILERKLKVKLRDLQAEARAHDQTIDELIKTKYEGKDRVAFGLEKSLYEEVKEDRTKIDYEKEGWTYYQDPITNKIIDKIYEKTKTAIPVSETERKEIELYKEITSNYIKGPESEGWQYYRKKDTEEYYKINTKTKEIKKVSTEEIDELRWSIIESGLTTSAIALPSIEELTGRVIKETKITSLTPKEINDYFTEENGLIRELKDKGLEGIYGEEGISVEVGYDESLREITHYRIRHQDNTLETVWVRDLNVWAVVDKDRHDKYFKMLNYIAGRNADLSAYGRLVGLTKRPVKKPIGEQCTDVMSPTDCEILFFSCDPVMCPTSRFNLGGRLEVDNVIQSGLVGSLILGLPRRTVCLSGILAALKNLRSVLQGYVNCLVAAKVQGTSVGICDKIRSIFICEILWQTVMPLLKEGFWNWINERVLAPMLGFKKGEGEYFTGEAIRGVRANIDYFTKSYAGTIFAAYNAKSTKEIGTEICKRMYYGKLPGVGDFIDEMMAAGNPVQYFAILSVKPYTGARIGEAARYHSAYQVYYHIYAGGYDITYAIVLKGIDISGRALPEWYIKRPAVLNTEEFADETVDLPGPEGYNQICVVVDGKFNCGFGKVTSTSLVANEINKYFIQHDLASNIRTEKDCRATFEGVLRQCSSENPGRATNPERWVKVGECEDLGKGVSCWLDASSIQGEKAQDLFYETKSCKNEIGGEICDANQICVGGGKVESSETVNTADFCCKGGVCANDLMSEVKTIEENEYEKINQETKSGAGNLLKEADTLFNEGNYQKATDSYENIKENYDLSKENEDYLNYKLGASYYKLAWEQYQTYKRTQDAKQKEYAGENARKAITALKKVTTKEYLGDAFLFTALSYIVLGDPNKAIDLLKSSELDKNGYAFFYTGYAYEAQGKLNEAKERYLETIRLFPGGEVENLAKERLDVINEILEDKKKDIIREIRSIAGKPSSPNCDKIDPKIKELKRDIGENLNELSKEEKELLAEAEFLYRRCYFDVAESTPRPAYYDKAIAQFQDIKDKYSGTEYGDDILYYLGKSYFKAASLQTTRKKEYEDNAYNLFTEFIREYRTSEYHPQVLDMLEGLSSPTYQISTPTSKPSESA